MRKVSIILPILFLAVTCKSPQVKEIKTFENSVVVKIFQTAKGTNDRLTEMHDIVIEKDS